VWGVSVKQPELVIGALRVVVWVNSDLESGFEALLAGEMLVSVNAQTGNG
jgi:hypothetical protein